jgi:transketolase
MNKAKALRVVYGETLARLGAELPAIVVLDADLSKSTRTASFAKAFPGRFHDIGIAEQDMLATAAGLATAGMIPFASTFAIFATGRAWEQLRNSICYPNLNVKLVATHGGITVGEDGGSHQAIEDLAVTRVIPSLRVIVPADGPETAQVIETIAREPGPFYVRLPRGEGPDVHGADYRFQIGRAPVLRPGGDVTLAACGLMVDVALRAAQQLHDTGVEARVINVSTLKPLDVETLRVAAAETGAVVTIEEHSVIGGLGSAVCEALAGCCPVPVLRVGMQDEFGQSGRAEELLVHYGLTAEAVAQRARDVLELRRSLTTRPRA